MLFFRCFKLFFYLRSFLLNRSINFIVVLFVRSFLSICRSFRGTSGFISGRSYISVRCVIRVLVSFRIWYIISVRIVRSGFISARFARRFLSIVFIWCVICTRIRASIICFVVTCASCILRSR